MSDATLRRRMTGRVVSDKGDKSLVALVTYAEKHPIGKIVKRQRKIQAHDETNLARIGDTVVLEECRPMSKTKSWRLVEVVDASAEQGASS